MGGEPFLKAFRIIDRVFTGVIAVVLVLIVLIGVLPQVFGYQHYTVISGSMEPKYQVGCLIYVKSVPSEEIDVGDPITFRMGGKIITHQVIEADREANAFITKGIANQNTTEGPIPYTDVIGKASSFSIPYAGYAFSFLSSATGKILLLCAVGVLILLVLLEKIFTTGKKKEAR